MKFISINKIVLGFFIACSSAVFAQPLVVDQIIAVVGDKIILQSDLELQALQVQQQGYTGPDVECQLLDQMLTSKMFVIQAEIDSVIVDPNEVDAELDARVDYYISLFGSQEAFEQYYSKSIVQIKDEFRKDIEQQLLAKKMRSKIVGDVKVTPSEVKEFFSRFPQDSLPYIDAQIEVGQLVVLASVNQDQKDYARGKVQGYKDRIDNGEVTFEYIAKVYSEDTKALKDGTLGWFRRGERSKEFDAVAWNLQPGQISTVVETPEGFELIKMDDRKGDKALFKHILVKVKISEEDLNVARVKCDSIRHLIVTEKMSFSNAVYKFTEDGNTKNSGGMFLDPQTGNSKIEVSLLKEYDPTMVFMLDTLNPGEVSRPSYYVDGDGNQGMRLVYLKSKNQPHILNLTDDYDRIQQIAEQAKQQGELINWLVEKIKQSYIQVDERYQTCEVISYWLVNNTKTE